LLLLLACFFCLLASSSSSSRNVRSQFQGSSSLARHLKLLLLLRGRPAGWLHACLPASLDGWQIVVANLNADFQLEVNGAPRGRHGRQKGVVVV
jgi:hypothetical protein